MISWQILTQPREARETPPDFPLFPHANGRWAKKVRQRFCYFGRWDGDPKGTEALKLWLDQKDELLAGRTPRLTAGGLTVADLVNGFLGRKESLIETGELQPRTCQDYYVVCERIIKVCGRTRLVSDLGAEDFAD